MIDQTPFERRLLELEARPIRGYFTGDAELWRDAGELARESACPMSIRIRALRVIDRITGEDGELTPASVEKFTLDTGRVVAEAP